MSQATLRNDNGNPFVYLEGGNGSTAVGLIGATDVYNIVVSNATTNIDPTSGTPSISIDPAANGNISFQPQGSGESNFITGDVNIEAGNLQMPNTTTGFAEGAILLNSTVFMHNYSFENTALGSNALSSITTANQNTAIGYQSLAALTAPGIGGGLNTAVGTGSLRANTVGRFNTAIGTQALVSLNGNGSTGAGGDLFNAALGCEAGWAMTSGTNNTLIGAQAGVATLLGSGLLTGSNNTIIGAHAGQNYTGAETSNILIGNAGTTGESDVIRIGDGTTQTAFFTTGVNGTSVTAAGTVVVSASGQLGSISGVTPTVWNDVASTPVTMAANNGYVVDDGASLVTLALPAVAAFGSRFEIVGKGSGGWTITEAAGQTIYYGTSTCTTTTGSLSSTQTYDCVELICVTANTTFVVKSSIGNLTVV